MISAPNIAITAAGNGIGSDCDEIRNELDRKFGRDHVVGGSNIEDDYYAYIWARLRYRNQMPSLDCDADCHQ